MAEGVRIELTSSLLESEVLAFERTLNVYGASQRLNAGLLFARETNSHRLEKFKDTPAIIS